MPQVATVVTLSQADVAALDLFLAGLTDALRHGVGIATNNGGYESVGIIDDDGDYHLDGVLYDDGGGVMLHATEASRNSDPGEAKVLIRTSYKIQGVSKTGTYPGWFNVAPGIRSQ